MYKGICSFRPLLGVASGMSGTQATCSFLSRLKVRLVRSWRVRGCLLTSGFWTSWKIFMRFGMNVMSLEDTRSYCINIGPCRLLRWVAYYIAPRSAGLASGVGKCVAFRGKGCVERKPTTWLACKLCVWYWWLLQRGKLNCVCGYVKHASKFSMKQCV